LDHYNRNNLTHRETFSNPALERHRFSLPPGYYPTVAFQDVRFTDYPQSRSTVVFLEQKLIKDQSTTSSSSSIPTFRFERHFQAYNFEFLDRIVNVTDSQQLPDYIERVPAEFEITGIFNWKCELFRISDDLNLTSLHS